MALRPWAREVTPLVNNSQVVPALSPRCDRVVAGKQLGAVDAPARLVQHEPTRLDDAHHLVYASHSQLNNRGRPL